MFACKIGKKYGRGYPDRRRVPFYNFPLVFREVQGKKNEGGILSNMDKDGDEDEEKQDEEKQDEDEDLIKDKDMDRD